MTIYFRACVSRLEFLGLFVTSIIVENVQIPFTFHVVPNNTINYWFLLGRDFIQSENFEISLGQELQIREKEKSNHISNEIQCLMLVDVNSPNDNDPILKIRELFDNKTRKEVKNIILDYINYPKPNRPKIDFECKINVTNTEPFSLIEQGNYLLKRKINYN